MIHIAKELEKHLGTRDFKHTRLVCKAWFDLFPLLKHCLPSPEAQYLSNLSFLDKITNLDITKFEVRQDINFINVFPQVSTLKISTCSVEFYKFINLQRLIVASKRFIPNCNNAENVVELAGLWNLTNLVSLESGRSTHFIDSFSNLSKLTKLTIKSITSACSKNYIDNVKHLISLEEYKGYYDDELLGKLTNLTSLKGYCPHAGDIKIAHLTKLTHLDIGRIFSNQLRLLTKLTKLKCIFNDDCEIDLSHLQQLKNLQIYHSHKLSNNTFVHMKHLTYLSCHKLIVDGRLLSHLINLETFAIDIGSFNIGSLAPLNEGLHHLINLRTLNVCNTDFRHINVTGADFAKLSKMKSVIIIIHCSKYTLEFPLPDRCRDLRVGHW
jgi:hypothetical protein